MHDVHITLESVAFLHSAPGLPVAAVQPETDPRSTGQGVHPDALMKKPGLHELRMGQHAERRGGEVRRQRKAVHGARQGREALHTHMGGLQSKEQVTGGKV